MRPLRFTADLALGAVALVAVPVAAVGHRVRVLVEPVVWLRPGRADAPAGARPSTWSSPPFSRRCCSASTSPRSSRDHVDIESIVDEVDIVAITNQVLAEIDLPEIIRQSTGSVASETVRGVRMQAITADDAVSKLSERFRLRRARPVPASAGALPAGPVPEPL